MKKPIVILMHLGYWIVFLFLLVFCFLLIAPSMRDYQSKLFLPWLVNMWIPIMIGFAIVPGAISFYTSYTLLFDKFLQKKKIFYLILAVAATSILAVICGQFTMYLYNEKLINSVTSGLEIGIVMGIGAILSTVIGLVMRGFIDFYGDIKVKEELNKKNFEMELALVKSQLNPHFLFNTLNNIDVLIEKNSAKASVYLNKLSDIMRFMLYEAKTEKIPLEKEIEYVEKYIELQKIRASNPSYVNYSLSGNPENIMIEPMLFIPFIENAFKYADNKKTENAIDIHFKIDDETVTFNCVNAKNSGYYTSEKNGLGNELIKKRLELLYPKKHKLKIDNDKSTYKVNLVLTL